MSEYKNPFSQYDANIMSSEQIHSFFAEPYETMRVSEDKIINDKSPIILVGGRGTGKTMLLRQFSHDVQKMFCSVGEKYIERIKKTRYIGVYFRIDKPLLKSLSLMGKEYKTESFEEDVFSHFLELTIFKELIEVIVGILNDLGIGKERKEYDVVLEDLCYLLFLNRNNNIQTIEELLDYVVKEINYIWVFQSRKSIDITDTETFTPTCGLIMQGRLTDDLLKTRILHTLGIDDTSILLLIDEYESFSEKQQKVINASMRYNKSYGVKLRIGMRPYGFKTHATINTDEFVKEGRDYSKIELGNPLIRKNNDRSYFDYVKKIAEKRLHSMDIFTGKSIEDILGSKEDYDDEAKNIVKGRNKHIDEYLRIINKNRCLENHISFEDISFIKDENPLIEMECLRLLATDNSIDFVKKAVSDFRTGTNSIEMKKFANDYNRKYKLTFLFVLCSIYRVERKMYYSFSGYCYVSSGIVGTFIELCRRAFDIAFFRDRDALMKGKISKEIQTDAAYECSRAERDMIKHIPYVGKTIEQFIDNLGNSFSYIHKDIYMRYPETNMFPLKGIISDENMQILDTAREWSIIIRKPNPKKTEENSRDDVYLLNRVFSPYYNISYRTRGGLSPIKGLSDDYFNAQFSIDKLLSNRNNREIEGQISFIEYLDEGENGV